MLRSFIIKVIDDEGYEEAYRHARGRAILILGAPRRGRVGDAHPRGFGQNALRRRLNPCRSPRWNARWP